jgi:hypothetical protein
MDIPSDISDQNYEIKLRQPQTDVMYDFVEVQPRHEPLADFLHHLEDDPKQESGGSIRVIDHENRLLEIDRDDGEMYFVDEEGPEPKSKIEEINETAKTQVKEQETNAKQIVISSQQQDKEITKTEKQETINSSSPMVGETPILARDANKKGKRARSDTRESERDAITGGNRPSSREPENPVRTKPLETFRGDIGFVDMFERIEIEDSASDELEALAVSGKALVSGSSDNLKFVVYKKHKLPFGSLEIYRQWLIEEQKVHPDHIPIAPVYSKIKPGIKLLYPSGQRWRDLVRGIKSQKVGCSASIEEQDFIDRMTDALIEDGRVAAKLCHGSLYHEACLAQLVDTESNEVNALQAFATEIVGEGNNACDELFNNLEAHSAKMTGKQLTALLRARRRKESQRSKAVGSGLDPPPTSIAQAYSHPRGVRSGVRQL